MKVFPGGERRPGFNCTPEQMLLWLNLSQLCGKLVLVRKHHARESVFRSERMPVSIDRQCSRAVLVDLTAGARVQEVEL